MTIEKQTVIAGYRVELEINGPETHCYVSQGDNSASLEALFDGGCLTNSRGFDHPLPDSVIEKIEKWAEANGYFA
jgi:hypothetical protein